MDEVSGHVVSLALEIARKADVPLETLIDGLGIPAYDLGRRPRPMKWDHLVELMARLGREVGGPEALRQIGRESARSDSFRIFEIVGRAVSHPADLYYMGVRWMGPALFPMIRGEIVELPHGRLRETLTIAPGQRDAPELFHIFHGAFEAMPLAWGHGESEIDLELRPNQAILTITPHSTSRGLLGRFVRAIHRRIAFRSLLDQVGHQQSAIHDGFWELREAHAQIQSQAEDLQRINAIGRDLARQIDLDRVSDVLVSTLIDELDVEGVELWLAPPEAFDAENARLYRSGGAMEGAPTDTFSLGTAGRDIGTLLVWRRRRPPALAQPFSTAHAPNRDSVLERLVPWISMALDNARTYSALRSHASDLEQRVRERTARLLTANHHLVREIEERKRATDALLESESQLRVSERLASVGTLAAGIAHEINNPVGAILAAAQFAQVVEQEDGDREQVGIALVDIVREAKRCGGIVRSVLQFARDERTDKWDCRLDDILRRAVRIAQPLTDENEARIDLTLPTVATWVKVNPIQIEQAIVNLLRNAIQAGSRRIRLALERVEAEQLALVLVDDDGPGIPDDERARIFEPFYTTRRDAGGTGLGLSVVHGIASEHLGQLKIETSEAGGVAALLELPLAAPPAQPYAEKRSAGVD